MLLNGLELSGPVLKKKKQNKNPVSLQNQIQPTEPIGSDRFYVDRFGQRFENHRNHLTSISYQFEPTVNRLNRTDCMY